MGLRPPTTRRVRPLADSSRRHNPWAADIYDRARARGAGHPTPTRILGRAWCQIIWRLWHDHDTYDPTVTPPCNTLLATTRDHLTRRGIPRTDLTARQRRPTPPSPKAARRAKHEALDRKPTDATPTPRG